MRSHRRHGAALTDVQPVTRLRGACFHRQGSLQTIGRIGDLTMPRPLVARREGRRPARGMSVSAATSRRSVTQGGRLSGSAIGRSNLRTPGDADDPDALPVPGISEVRVRDRQILRVNHGVVKTRRYATTAVRTRLSGPIGHEQNPANPTRYLVSAERRWVLLAPRHEVDTRADPVDFGDSGYPIVARPSVGGRRCLDTLCVAAGRGSLRYLIPTQAKRNLSSRSGIGGVRSAT